MKHLGEWELWKRPIEDSPSTPKRNASSSLLVSLLGQSFTDTEGTVEPKTPDARAEEELERCCKSLSLPLTEDPLNWRVQEITFPLLSAVKAVLVYPRHKRVCRVSFLHCR